MENLQALLHPECLGVIIHIDNVFPHALRRLAPLGLGVLDLRGAEEAALLSKVSVLVRVIILAPGAVVVAVVISQLLVCKMSPLTRFKNERLFLTRGDSVNEIICRLFRNVRYHVLAQPPVGFQQSCNLIPKSEPVLLFEN